MNQLTCNVEILHRAQMGQDVYIRNTYVPNIYIQDLKNIKNVKGCRDGMPKSVQTR